MNKLDKQYTDLLQTIIDYGVEKKDRTGTGTKSIFGYTIRHKMSDGFPLHSQTGVMPNFLALTTLQYEPISSELTSPFVTGSLTTCNFNIGRVAFFLMKNSIYSFYYKYTKVLNINILFLKNRHNDQIYYVQLELLIKDLT